MHGLLNCVIFNDLGWPLSQISRVRHYSTFNISTCRLISLIPHGSLCWYTEVCKRRNVRLSNLLISSCHAILLQHKHAVIPFGVWQLISRISRYRRVTENSSSPGEVNIQKLSILELWNFWESGPWSLYWRPIGSRTWAFQKSPLLDP